MNDTGNDNLIVFAAGSLRWAMTDIIDRWNRENRPTVRAEFGPSGLWREEIENGRRPDIFVSADMGHPRVLTRAGLAGPTVLFTRNTLCLYGRIPEQNQADDIIDYLLDPGVRLGTSTPVDDPSGDYAWCLFEKMDRQRPGCFGLLERKARPLVGGRGTIRSTDGRSPVLTLFEQDRIDVFIGYRTSALLIRKALPYIDIMDLPPGLAVPVECGLTVLTGRGPAADRLAHFLLSPTSQTILAGHGFKPVVPAGSIPG